MMTWCGMQCVPPPLTVLPCVPQEEAVRLSAEGGKKGRTPSFFSVIDQ
jgi:hypothetical protein